MPIDLSRALGATRPCRRLLPIIEAMPVDLLFDSGQTYGGKAYQDCIASARRHGVRIVIARRGMRWSSGDGLTLDLLAPSLPFLTDTGDDVNENSIVTMLHYRNFRELFMGDAGEASEARLLAFGDDLRGDAAQGRPPRLAIRVDTRNSSPASTRASRSSRSAATTRWPPRRVNARDPHRGGSYRVSNRPLRCRKSKKRRPSSTSSRACREPALSWSKGTARIAAIAAA